MKYTAKFDVTKLGKVVNVSHIDNDGHASSAIVKYFCPQARLLNVNYGTFQNWGILEDYDTVIITDFTLPVEVVQRMQGLGRQVIWIDHHPVSKEMQEVRRRTQGVTDKRASAALLTWKFFCDQPVPKIIEYVSDYDLFEFKIPTTMEFNRGTRIYSMEADRNMRFWTSLIENDRKTDKITAHGRVVEAVNEQYRLKFRDDFVFRTRINDLEVLVANVRGFDSTLFNKCDLEGIEALVTFGYSSKLQHWRCSIYNAPGTTTNVRPTAIRYGGGGHEGAAGFECLELPFEIPLRPISPATPLTPFWSCETIVNYEKTDDVLSTSAFINYRPQVSSSLYTEPWEDMEIGFVNCHNGDYKSMIASGYDIELDYVIFWHYDNTGRVLNRMLPLGEEPWMMDWACKVVDQRFGSFVKEERPGGHSFLLWYTEKPLVPFKETPRRNYNDGNR